MSVSGERPDQGRPNGLLWRGADRILRGLRNHWVRRTAIHAATNSPFYRRRFRELGIDWRDIRSVADVPSLGFFTTPEEIVEDNTRFLAVSPEKVERRAASSGTTGAAKTVFLTRKDVREATMAAVWCWRFRGVRRKDTVLCEFRSVDPRWPVGPLMDASFRRMGLSVAEASEQRMESFADALERERPSDVVGVPTFVKHLTEIIVERRSPGEMGLSRIHLGGEPFSESLRERLQHAWSAEVFDSYGLIEAGPFIAGEFPGQKGLRVSPGFLVEVVDPETGEPVEPGAMGELVITTLRRQGTPLLRYRTRDLTRCLANGETAFVRIGRIVGRADDMVTVGHARNLHPDALGEVVHSLPGVVAWQLEIVDAEGAAAHRLDFRLEATDEDVAESLPDLLFRALPILGMEAEAGVIELRVRTVAPGTLTSVGNDKVRRIVDRRGVRYPEG